MLYPAAPLNVDLYDCIRRKTTGCFVEQAVNHAS